MYNEFMLVILTHENADFDAVASQLAASKLYPKGLPLLSWRVNRNVEQYLSLFWDAYPFLRPEDWQRQRIQQVVLVDTQSLPSIRGLRPDRTHVQIIDHHERNADLNPEWSCLIDQVGATTTIMTEQLQESGIKLNANEATLMLLGIHEDTGSLVYDTTTSRDAQAAAWLLGQGAQLSVVRRFLNIPLSGEQQALSEALQEAAEWVTIEGQSIVVASVEAPEGFADEISAVAHRLRDTLTPTGLILLVQLKHNHVQLVARSVTDNVDVSVIAKALGGGGHSRAAAATIMDRDLPEVRHKIFEILPEAVKPMAKVSEIMSYGVQTITSSAKVKEAAERMQRFGHEGYPVINPENNRLVGLLTRRLVDRAMSHQLGDLPVSQVMRAGRVTVRPADSVERVQRLMIEEGWGQIPVLPDNSGGDNNQEVIGIVTRTDLINLMNNQVGASVGPDMKTIMDQSLPDAVWNLVQVVGDMSDEMDLPLYFVGGLVRDLLLGVSPSDIDMVVEGDAIRLVKNLKHRYGGDTRSHAQFGTAKWILSPSVWTKIGVDNAQNEAPLSIDFVTARSEFYNRPTALPEVEKSSIKLDLHRRDFTINTLAVRLDGLYLGQLLDFYGGYRDLESGVIRVLHSLSFVDDPTRILRAVRLEQRLNFVIEPRTVELIAVALDMLDRVTGDRIRNELEMCLLENKRIQVIARLDDIGVLAQLHPELKWTEQTAERYLIAESVMRDPDWNEALAYQSPAFVYFALLLWPFPWSIQDAIITRLKVRKSTKEDIQALQLLLKTLSSLPANASASQVFFALKPFPTRTLLVAYAGLAPDTSIGKRIEKYQKEWRFVRTALNGNDLLSMGMKSGPQIGMMLDRLLAARLDGEVFDKEGEYRLIKSMNPEGLQSVDDLHT